MFDYKQIIDKYYPAGTPLRDIYMRHCRSVTDKALAINARLTSPLPSGQIEAAAMLHDIGIFLTDAPGIQCHGTSPYLAHGRLGADLLRAEGAPEELALVAERHTGTGIPPCDIANYDGILTPDRSYMPESTLEQLICYADKFYSKNGDMQEKTPGRIRASLAKFGDAAVERFDRMRQKFGD